MNVAVKNRKFQIGDFVYVCKLSQAVIKFNGLVGIVKHLDYHSRFKILVDFEGEKEIFEEDELSLDKIYIVKQIIKDL